MKSIFSFLNVVLLVLVLTVGFALGDNNRSDRNTSTTLSNQCQSFTAWFTEREQKLLVRLGSSKRHKQYSTAEEILEHSQNHITTVVAKAIDVAYAGKLYNTIRDISKVVLNNVDNDSGIFEKFNEACNENIIARDYKYDPALRIEGASTLGDFARIIYFSNQTVNRDDRDLTSHYMNMLIDTFEDCLTSDAPDLVKSACAEASGNTYSQELKPILLTIVNDPNSNPVLALTSARSLTQIDNISTTTTKAQPMLLSSDPPHIYVTPDMINRAMNYIQQFIPNTY